MKVVQKMPSIHIPIQKPDGSMEWVWYMFLQWLSEHLEDTDLSDYFTKEEINEMLTDYALDDGVVHKAGAETITGNKNFSGTNDFYSVKFSTAPTTAISSSWGPVIRAKASFITSNYDIPGEGQHWQTQGVDVMANDNSYLSWTSTSRYSDGSTNYSICVRARADAESPNKDASIGIRVWPDGTSLSFAPNPVYSSNTTAIATTYWVRNLITTSTDLVHRTGNETINGIKTFNAEIKGRFRTASCHMGPDNTNCWYKIGEFKSRGTYNTHLVMFRAWVGVNGTQVDGLVCGRIVTRTGATGTGSEGKLGEGRVVFDTKPAWLDLNNFAILYKNDQTDDTGDYVQIEFWARTYSAYNGYTFSIFDERAGGEAYNPLWTFYNLPSGAADLPTGYTGQVYSQAPNNTNTAVVHTSGNETIDGYKTFTDPTTTVYLTVNPLNDSPTSQEGGEISFVGASGEVNAGKPMFIDRCNGRLRLYGYDSSATVHVQLEADAEHNTLYGVAPTEDTTTSRQIDTVGARNTKLQGYQPLLTAGSNIAISGNTISATDTTYSVMTGATSSAAGTSGLVPAPASGDNDKFLKGDGTWGAISGGGYYPDLFDTKWSDHQVNDIQWLRADTFSWQDGGVYEAAYQHLADEYAALPFTSCTDFSYNGDTYVRFPAEDHLSDSHAYAYANIYSYPVNIVYSDEDYIHTDGSDIYNGSDSSATNLGTVTSNSTLTYHMPLLETVAGIKIMYYVAQDGHKIVLDVMESVVEAIYTATGVAWYYILDVVNTRFKLPRTKFGFMGLRDNVGKYVEAAIPNLTCSIGNSNKYRNDGCLSIIDSGNGFAETLGNASLDSSDGGTASVPYGFSLNASRVSDVYKDGATTVQPPATQMYLYFYVGQFTQTALENTAGLNASLFNDKADIDLSNLNVAGKAVAANLSMPSGTYDSLTIGATGATYTAPADGYFWFGGLYDSVNAATSVVMRRTSDRFGVTGGTDGRSVTGGWCAAVLPVSKGDTIAIYYFNLTVDYALRFYYANGEK